jgi:hypothetical protein
MRAFIYRWYGDRCPVWTWPVTLVTLAVIGLTWALVADLADQARCERNGGNTIKARACYLVTETRIY